MHNHNRRSLQDKLREKFLQFSSHLSNAQETKTVKLTGKEFSTTYQKKECTLKTGVVTRTKLQRNAMFSLILTSTFMADSNYTHEGGVSVPGASLYLALCALCATEAIEPARWEFLCLKLVVVHISGLQIAIQQILLQFCAHLVWCAIPPPPPTSTHPPPHIHNTHAHKSFPSLQGNSLYGI